METTMGMVYTDITLKNAFDVGMARHGLIKEPEVRSTTVQAVVDTGAGTLIINETVRKQLGLVVLGLREASLANGEKAVCKVTDTVEVHWKDRSMSCQAWVLPGGNEVLLGAIPLEDMDLMINPAKQELVGAHGDEILGYIY